MSSSNSRILLKLAVCLMVIGLTACGSASSTASSDPSGSLPGNAVAQVGSVVITKTMLAGEMAATFGGDYFEAIGDVAPTALVSEPANLSACVAELKVVLAARRSSAPAAQSRQKCEQLYEAIKEQALVTLLSDQWYIGLDAEEGVKVSNAEVEEGLRRLEARDFPKKGEFQAYLADHRWPVAQELLLEKMDLLAGEILARLKAPGGRRIATALNNASNKWVERTNCRAGYIVVHCRQYRAGSATFTALSPAVLIEQIAR